MEYFFHLFLLLVYFISNEATELTFELPDNQKQCFFEKIDKGVKSTLEFQVITGGQYDVDLELVAPNGQILYKDVKKQYDSFTWNADQTGIHKFCFSNEFSTFSHKVVYFDLEVGEEKPIVQEMAGNAHATAMTLMETGCVEIHEALKYIADGQTHYRLREAQGRIFAQTLNSHVLYWSLGMTLLIMIVSVGQVFVLRGFFSEKKSTIKPTVLS